MKKLLATFARKTPYNDMRNPLLTPLGFLFLLKMYVEQSSHHLKRTEANIGMTFMFMMTFMSLYVYNIYSCLSTVSYSDLKGCAWPSLYK